MAGREILIDIQHISRMSVSPERISDEIKNWADPVRGGDSEAPRSADDCESDEARIMCVIGPLVRSLHCEAGSHAMTHILHRLWRSQVVEIESKRKESG